MGIIADKIRKAIFGGEVRDSIADGIEVVEQLREDYDNQVINAGNSNAEIVDARGGQAKLKDRLDNFDEQLDTITHGVINYNKGIFTIIDDDGYSSFINRWKPICDSKGIKISIAINTDRVGNGACMTLEQLKQLKSEGYDLLSHSANHPNMNTTLLEDLETDWKRSLQYMKDNNLGDDLAIVYPVGLLDIATEQRVLDIKSLTRRYYKYGIDANIGVGGNSLPVDSYEIKRRFFNPTTYNLSTIKSAIDNAKTNNEWLILLTHCGMDNQWSDETSPSIYSEIIDYVQSIGMPIMTFRQAESLVGNIISHGDSRTKNFNFISKNGATWARRRKDYVNPMEVSSMNALIDEYPKYVVHRQQISNVQDTFLSKGGILETYRGDSMFSYQLFYVAQSNSIYKRTYNDTSKTWSSFTGLVGNDFTQILTLNNNWTGTLTATKNNNGIVTIKGSLTVGTNSNTIIANLPTIYRPQGQTPVLCMKPSTNTSVIPFSIFTNGNIITTASNGLNSGDVIEVCFTFSTI